MAAPTLFSDDFTNTTAPDKGLGPSWTLVSGLWYAKNDTAISDLHGQDEAQENVASCLDCSVQATVTTYGVAEAGVFLRSSASAPTTHYDFVLLANGHGEIRSVVNGVATSLGDVATGLATLSSPVTLELTASGISPVALTGAVNGVTLLQVVDSSNVALTAAGYAGLWTNYAGVPFGAFILTGAQAPPPPPPDAGVLLDGGVALDGGVGVPFGGTVLFSDNFTNTTVPDKGLGPSWTLVSGLWYAKNDTAITDQRGQDQAQENVASCLDCSVQATVISYGVAEAGVFLRSSASTPTTHYDFVLLSNGHVEIRRVVNGVATSLGDAPSGLPALNTPTTLSLTAHGGGPVMLTGAVNGVTLLQVTDSSTSALTGAGYAGLWTTSAGVPFGAFTLTSLAGGSTAPRVYQDGFNQALRWSTSYGSLTTLRIKVPIGLTGPSIELALKSGSGPLTISRASVAAAGPGGSLASTPIAVTFNGAPGCVIPASSQLLSDPTPLPVAFGEELYVTLELQGAAAASAISAFPNSYEWSGPGATLPSLPANAGLQTYAHAVTAVYVQAPKVPVFVAIGDSITEGYSSGTDDTRKAWPFVAQMQLGFPVVNAAVSGQDVWGELLNYQTEITPLQNITDCVVDLGTNDLPCSTPAQVESLLAQLYSDLRPMCRIWATTMIPRERTNYGSIQQVRVCRDAINTWIRTQADVYAVIDFDAVMRDPSNPEMLIPAYENDGVHPTPAGYAVMGAEAARVIREQYPLALP
jgi:lysophospholipase L1-like esterase